MKLERSRRTEFAPVIFFPMLNVVLLLLLFFILGSQFVLQPGISLSLPGTSFALPPQPGARFISVTAGNPARIFVDEIQTTVDGLREILAETSAPAAPIIIRADRGARFESVLEVADRVLGLGYPVAVAGVSQAQ